MSRAYPLIAAAKDKGMTITPKGEVIMVWDRNGKDPRRVNYGTYREALRALEYSAEYNSVLKQVPYLRGRYRLLERIWQTDCELAECVLAGLRCLEHEVTGFLAGRVSSGAAMAQIKNLLAGQLSQPFDVRLGHVAGSLTNLYSALLRGRRAHRNILDHLGRAKASAESYLNWLYREDSSLPEEEKQKLLTFTG